MSTHTSSNTLGWEIGCAICGPATDRPGEPLLLSRGITVWLCPEHMAGEYRLKQGGIVFVDDLSAVWEASCGLTVRRQEALTAHLRWVRQVIDALQPPTFVEPWLVPRQPREQRKRTKRRGGALRTRATMLRPATPRQPLKPTPPTQPPGSKPATPPPAPQGPGDSTAPASPDERPPP